jgi:phosphoribosylamine--glycine ligase
VHLTHAATAHDGERLVAAGGRVLSVVARGDSFAEARTRAYDALGRIELQGGQYRRDIAAKVAE